MDLLKRSILIAAATLVTTLSGVTLCLGAGEAAKAPAVTLKGVGGEAVNVASLVGSKPVLLVFWATWCTNCREEVPLLNRLNSGRFRVVAVNEGESAWKTKRFVSTNNVGYQVLLDPDGAAAKAFQVPGIPGSVVINRAGMVVLRGTGLPENIDSFAE